MLHIKLFWLVFCLFRFNRNIENICFGIEAKQTNETNVLFHIVPKLVLVVWNQNQFRRTPQARHLPYVVLVVVFPTTFPHNMKTRQRLVLQNCQCLAELTECVERRLKKGWEYLYMCEERFSILCVHDSITMSFEQKDHSQSLKSAFFM